MLQVEQAVQRVAIQRDRCICMISYVQHDHALFAYSCQMRKLLVRRSTACGWQCQHSAHSIKGGSCAYTHADVPIHILPTTAGEVYGLASALIADGRVGYAHTVVHAVAVTMSAPTRPCRACRHDGAILDAM